MRHKVLLVVTILIFAGVLTIFGYFAFQKPRDVSTTNVPSQNPSLSTRTTSRVTVIDPVRGEKNATITIIEYADYLCTYCADLEPVIAQTLAAYPKKVRFVWKDFPNDALHPDASRSAEAARCAGEQGKYWEFHDLLLGRTDVFGLRPLEDWATLIGIDRTFMQDCLASERYKPQVNELLSEALGLKLTGAPSLFINNKPFEGRTFEEFKNVIDSIAK